MKNMKLRNQTLLALGLIAMLAAGCKRHDESKPPVPALPTANVRVQSIATRQHVATEDTVGTVRAKLQARLEAKVSGRILEMHAVPGQSVKTGEVLVRLDAQEVRARLEQALAMQQQAAGDLNRFTALLERTAATQAEFDAVQARARVAEAAVKEAQTMLGYADVLAPFNGVVTRKSADVGDLATPGKPLLEIEDSTALRLETDVPEAVLSRLKLGDRCPVRIAAVEKELAGVVSEISPTADPNSRTFRVKLDVPTVAGLRAGQFGRVAMPVGQTTALRAPVTAVVQRGQMEMVFVLKDGKAQMRLIKTGKRIGDEVELVSGVTAGEQVVTEGAADLVDGQPLTIKP